MIDPRLPDEPSVLLSSGNQDVIKSYHLLSGVCSYFFSISTTFPSPASLGRQLVWIIFAFLSMPSIYFAYKLQGDAKTPEKMRSSGDTYEALAGTDIDLGEMNEVDRWKEQEFIER